MFRENRVYIVGLMMDAYIDIPHLVKSVLSRFGLHISPVTLPAGQLLPLDPAVA